MEVNMPKKFDTSPAAVQRRRRVIQRLQTQLVTGYKPVNNGDGTMSTVKMTEDDRKRIEKEISILETRV